MSEDGGALVDRVERLHAELEATEELPVERTASRWIGEAQAVAADAANGGLRETVVRERVGHVAELLENVESTGDERADEHVATARELAVEIAGE
ncbi:MAG: hypothetical protein V5A44_02575 [Haloarculaceae archaeon]